ncbi:hypothetical protein KNE206_65990 [Kitasatospora sp. NE20-6]
MVVTARPSVTAGGRAVTKTGCGRPSPVPTLTGRAHRTAQDRGAHRDPAEEGRAVQDRIAAVASLSRHEVILVSPSARCTLRGLHRMSVTNA